MRHYYAIEYAYGVRADRIVRFEFKKDRDR